MLPREAKSPLLPVPVIRVGSRCARDSLAISQICAQRHSGVRLSLPLRCSRLPCFLCSAILDDEAQRLVEDVGGNHLAAHFRINAFRKMAPFLFQFWRNGMHL